MDRHLAIFVEALEKAASNKNNFERPWGVCLPGTDNKEPKIRSGWEIRGISKDLEESGGHKN